MYDDSVHASGGQYSVNPVLRNKNIDPGGEVVIDLYMTGWGEVQENKLSISFASEELLDQRKENKIDVKYMQIAEGVREDRGIPENFDGYVYVTDGDVELEVDQMEIGSPHIVLHFPQTFFNYNPTQSIEGKEYTSLMSECTHYPSKTDNGLHYPNHIKDGEGPVRIEFNTKESVSPGMYDIYFVFTYNLGGITFKDKRIVEVHVNNWMERNEKRLQVAGIILTLILIGSALANTLISLGFV